MIEKNQANTDVFNTLCEIACPEVIAEYKAQKYAEYVTAVDDFVAYHRFSDLCKMLDSGIACDMYTQEELKTIIAEQDELTQKILIAQFGKYLIVKGV